MLLDKISKNIQKILKKPNLKIVLGLSGGPDSVFLFHFLNDLKKQKKLDFVAAHLDHQWRVESYKDADFCKNLCEQNGVKIIIGKAQELLVTFKFNGSKEEVGRILRRKFLNQVLKEETADFIFLAHHLQDQQETFFWRIIRGCSLSGLTCMKQMELPYFRPLLNISKEEILSFLNLNKFSYVFDNSNESDLFLRNRIRKYVIPAIRKCDLRFDQKFETTMDYLQKEDTFLKKLTLEAFGKIFVESEKESNVLLGNLKEFLNLDEVLQIRLILHWFIKQKVQFNPSKNYLEEVLKFLKSSDGGIHKISKNFQISKKKNIFWLENT